MAYNYSAYGATYGQQYAGTQPSTYSSQQTGTTTAGYGQYGQTNPYGSSVSTSSTSTAASTSSTYGYGAGINTTSSNQQQTATNNYSYSGQQGYGYNYADAGSAYGNGNAQNSTLQSFQQAWYGGATSNAPNTSQQSPAGTTQQQTLQTQQYGNIALQSQYLQQYQQMMYQQYASSAATTSQQQQGMFKSPQPVGTKPRTGMPSVTSTQAKPEQPTSGWGSYNQRQEITPSSSRQNDSSNLTGWNSTQLQQQVQGGMSAPQQQQQQKSPVVQRSPMKYNQNDLPYSAMNQGYKSSNVNTGQGYNNSSQSFSMPVQGFNTTSNSLTNQAFSSPNQGYNMNMYKSGGAAGTYTNSGFNSPGFNNMQGFAPNQTYGNQNYNKGYIATNNSSNNQQNQPRPTANAGPKISQRGGMTGQMNDTTYLPFQSPTQQPRPLMQGMMMTARGRGGNVRPPMGRGSPIAGNMGFPGPTRPGAPDGPDIPPFPQAWHSQDFEGSGPGDWQRGTAGFGDVANRWARNGQRGRYPTQQMLPKGIYNNNSRNARGGPSTNRELWSPAEKNKSSATSNFTSDKDAKWSARSKDDGDSSDKNKNTEIKSFLYAWLGPRSERPNYDTKQVGEKPNISFQCELHVEKYSFVGFGEASSKKDAQTAAAWDFANHLVKNSELAESELPEKSQTKNEDSEKDFTSTGENEGEEVVENGDKKKEDESDPKSRDKKVDNRKMNVGVNQKRNKERERWSQHYSRGVNSAGRGGPRMGGMARGRPPPMDIPPLMAQPVGPWEGPAMVPPHMMPHPMPMMDYGGWPMPPNIPMGPPPPLMRRNYQNDYWRRRDMQERMRDDVGMRWNQDWQHPEDIFIQQMIMNQQEADKEHHTHRSHDVPPMEAVVGEWHNVTAARPVVTSDDRHVMAKHEEIYPQEGKLNNLYHIVNTVEQALKLLSDKFVDEDHPRPEENKDEKEKDVLESTEVNSLAEKIKESEDSLESEAKEQQAKANGEEDVFEPEKPAEDKEKDAANDEKINGEQEQEKDGRKDEKTAKIKILKRPKKAQKQVDTRPRVLCGVNRIGPLAKGLLISRDDHVDLALLCGEIPTVKLLNRILEHIGEKLSEVDKDFKLIVEKREDEAGFLVKSVDTDSSVEAMVTLTKSGLRRVPKKVEDNNAVIDESKKEEEEEKDEEEQEQSNENTEEEAEEEEKKKPAPVEAVVEEIPEGMLPREKMIEALACLRHTNWFQAKACSLQSCVILTRILRDLQRRDRVWLPLKEWALEVLIYNCLASSEEQMSAGDACRRFFEVIAGGILLPGRPGLQDPCEKAVRDVLDCCTVQEKEEITKSAQRFLRHLAFREIHKILGMEKLVPTYKSNAMDNRQSRLNTRSSSDAKESEEKSSDANNIRKRRFEHNGTDSQADSPKRSLTDEEDLVLDTDTQQNLAELSISDEASDGRSAQEDADSEPSTKEKTQDDNNTATESRSIEAEIDKVTQLEITVLEGSDDKRMETGSTEGEGKINKEEDVPHQSIMDT